MNNFTWADHDGIGFKFFRIRNGLGLKYFTVRSPQQSLNLTFMKTTENLVLPYEGCIFSRVAN